jgi:hypothetical protein
MTQLSKLYELTETQEQLRVKLNHMAGYPIEDKVQVMMNIEELHKDIDAILYGLVV